MSDPLVTDTTAGRLLSTLSYMALAPDESIATTLRVTHPGRVRPVRKAFEQAADQLRELIVEGHLLPGQRLPNEANLAKDFGISRATVREALRLLAAQNLIRSAKGANGGTFVTLPTLEGISDYLGSSIGALALSRDVSLDELLEARALLEVPAARLAAQRRSEDDVSALRDSIPEQPLTLTVHGQFHLNRNFHTTLIESCGNSLIYIAAQPIFSILQTHLSRSAIGSAVHRGINEHHRKITAAIESGDVAGAGEAMAMHLEFLRPAYERAWREWVPPGQQSQSG